MEALRILLVSRHTLVPFLVVPMLYNMLIALLSSSSPESSNYVESSDLLINFWLPSLLNNQHNPSYGELARQQSTTDVIEETKKRKIGAQNYVRKDKEKVMSCFEITELTNALPTGS